MMPPEETPGIPKTPPFLNRAPTRDEQFTEWLGNKTLEIEILCPTRGRPQHMKEMVQSISDTASKPELVRVSFATDNDDKETLDVLPDLSAYFEPLPLTVRLGRGPRQNPASVYNMLFERTAAEIIMYAGDDIRFRTKGWDETIRETFLASGDRILLVGCYDPARPSIPFPDHGFLSNWGCRSVKYVFPLFPPHPDRKNPISGGCSFTDVWVKPMYEIIGRLQFLPDITIEHLHWRAEILRGKPDPNPLDDGYVATNILPKACLDEEIFLRLPELPFHSLLLTKFIDWHRKKTKELGIDTPTTPYTDPIASAPPQFRRGPMWAMQDDPGFPLVSSVPSEPSLQETI
jgi:hypothetical protein